MKTIVDKLEINNNPKLSIIKAYRLATKHIGQAKMALANSTSQEEMDVQNANIIILRSRKNALVAMAQEAGFKIWTNENGKTGHTYEKDYKETADIDNDFDAFQLRINPPILPITEGPTFSEAMHIVQEQQLPEEENFDSGEY